MVVLGRKGTYRSSSGRNYSPTWECRCDCGKKTVVSGSSLRTGNTSSCGCLKTEGEDETGNRFGSLVVVEPVEDSRRGAFWRCKCDCGGEAVVKGASLRYGKTKSCGCSTLKHGRTNTPEHRLLMAARRRAREFGVPFDLELDDFPVIPDECPILKIPLKRGIGHPTDNSPSLDRVVPELGYTKENVRIISYRANRIKNDSSLDEVLSVASYIMRASDNLMAWADYKQDF